MSTNPLLYVVTFHGGPADGLTKTYEGPPPSSIVYLGGFYTRGAPGDLNYYYQVPIRPDALKAWHGLMRTLAHSVPQAIRASARARARTRRLLR